MWRRLLPDAQGTCLMPGNACCKGSPRAKHVSSRHSTLGIPFLEIVFTHSLWHSRFLINAMARWAAYASFPHLEASGRPVIKIFPVGDLNSSREMKKLAQVLLILRWILLPLGYRARKGCLLSCPEEEVTVAVLRRGDGSVGMCVGYSYRSGVLSRAVPVGRSSCCAQCWRADVLLGAGGPAVPQQAGSRAAGVLLSWAKSSGVWQTACGAGPSW